MGTAIGTRSFTEEYVSKKVKLWCDEILTLSTIAKTHPHSAYDAFVSQLHGCRRLLLIPPCNHLVVNQSLQIQLFVVMMLRLTFMQEVSGADNITHFLILGFFILTHQAIVISRLHLYFKDMN